MRAHGQYIPQAWSVQYTHKMWGSRRCYILTDGVAYTHPCVLYNFMTILKDACSFEPNNIDLCVLETPSSKRRTLTSEQATKLAEVLKVMPRRSITVQEDGVSLALAFELGRLEIRMNSAETTVVFTDDEPFINLFKNAKINFGRVFIVSPRSMCAAMELEQTIRCAFFGKSSPQKIFTCVSDISVTDASHFPHRTRDTLSHTSPSWHSPTPISSPPYSHLSIT